MGCSIGGQRVTPMLTKAQPHLGQGTRTERLWWRGGPAGGSFGTATAAARPPAPSGGRLPQSVAPAAAGQTGCCWGPTVCRANALHEHRSMIRLVHQDGSMGAAGMEWGGQAWHSVRQRRVGPCQSDVLLASCAPAHATSLRSASETAIGCAGMARAEGSPAPGGGTTGSWCRHVGQVLITLRHRRRAFSGVERRGNSVGSWEGSGRSPWRRQVE